MSVMSFAQDATRLRERPDDISPQLFHFSQHRKAKTPVCEILDEHYHTSEPPNVQAKTECYLPLS